MAHSVLIAMILLVAGSVSVACALYALQGNDRSAIGRAFFPLSISLLAWNFGMAVATAAAERAVSETGMRMAAAGCSLTTAFLLHCVCLLINPRSASKKWWACPVIYLPGTALIYGLTVAPPAGLYEGAVDHTHFGWSVVTGHPLIWGLIAHCAVYSALAVALLARWAKRSGSATERRQARNLRASFSAFALLGPAVGAVCLWRNVGFPSVAGVLALLPVVSIGRTFERLHLARGQTVDPNERILDKAMLGRVNRIVALCFFAGSLISLMSWTSFEPDAAIPGTVLFSVILALIGAGVLRLDRLKVDESFKELIFALLFSLIIPVIPLLFIAYAGMSVWASFFLWLIISLLFNKRLLLVTVILSAVQTQILIWSIKPHIMLRMEPLDYMVRLCLVALASVLCCFANHVYRHRLKENAAYAVRQTLVSEISHSLVAVDEHNFDRKIECVLMQCAKYLRCERAYLALIDLSTDEVRYWNEWLAESVRGQQNACRAHATDFFPKIKDRLAHHRLMMVSESDALPDWADEMRAYLEQMDIRGFVLLPIVKNGESIGFISFGDCTAMADWDDEDVHLLPIIANTVADAVSKLADMRKIEWIAYHDQLTGLPNRMLFKKRLVQAIGDAERTGSMVGVAFLDLDAFKFINDTMGHEIGDQLLTKVSATISAEIRGYGSVARFGGDEFVLLVERLVRAEELKNVIQRVLDAIERPMVLQNQEFFVTGSVGVALYPQDGTSAEALINNADIAMYDAKTLGKRRFVFCSEALKNRVMDNTRLSNLLHRALERGELEVHYQPQVSLETQEIVGVEALLRWRLPDRGFISPKIFIPLAEQTGMIHAIGAWVMDTACRQCVRWHAMGFPALRMAVNVSVQQLRNRGFIQQVALVLAQTALPPDRLELEITESVANSGARGMVETLTHLKALGISLSIDDFGTEYSSLGRLKLLPIDRIKLDMQFVQGIELNAKDRAIAQVIVNLAKNLHLKVVAEGVETGSQLSFLRQKMCDEVQGYYFFKPMPASEMEQVLLRRRAGAEAPSDRLARGEDAQTAAY